MPARTGTAHVVTTTRQYKGRVYRTHLLRRSYREDGKVKNEQVMAKGLDALKIADEAGVTIC